MPVTCHQCNSPNTDTARFCRNCGAQLSFAGGAGVSQTPGYTPSVPPQPSWSPSYGGGYPAATPAMAPTMNYALWSDRVLGHLVDLLFVMVGMGALYLVGIVIFSIFGIVGGALGSAGAEDAGAVSTLFGGGMCCIVFVLFPLATLLIGAYNKVYLVSKRGASIGQGVMKLKVVNERGELLPIGTALLRLLAQIGLAFVPIGGLLDLLWPLWDEKRQTLHDKAVSSFVIKQA